MHPGSANGRWINVNSFRHGELGFERFAGEFMADGFVDLWPDGNLIGAGRPRFRQRRCSSRGWSCHTQFGMDGTCSKQCLRVLKAILMVCRLLVGAGWRRTLAKQMPAPMLESGYAMVLSLALLIRPITGKAFIDCQF